MARASSRRLLTSVQLQRAAAAVRRGHPTSQPSAASSRTDGDVHVAEEHPLHAALHEADGAARLARRRRSDAGQRAERRRRGSHGARTAPGAPAGRAARAAPAAAAAAGGGTGRRSRGAGAARAAAAATCAPPAPRVSSISLSYCTPDGQAVTQAMQPRQLSRWPTIGADSALWWPSSISTIRPRGESASSPHSEYVGQVGRQKPQCTQSSISDGSGGRSESHAGMVIGPLTTAPGARPRGRSAPSRVDSAPGSTAERSRAREPAGRRAPRTATARSALAAASTSSTSTHDRPSPARPTTRPSRRWAASSTSSELGLEPRDPDHRPGVERCHSRWRCPLRVVVLDHLGREPVLASAAAIAAAGASGLAAPDASEHRALALVPAHVQALQLQRRVAQVERGARPARAGRPTCRSPWPWPAAAGAGAATGPRSLPSDPNEPVNSLARS